MTDQGQGKEPSVWEKDRISTRRAWAGGRRSLRLLQWHRDIEQGDVDAQDGMRGLLMYFVL